MVHEEALGVVTRDVVPRSRHGCGCAAHLPAASLLGGFQDRFLGRGSVPGQWCFQGRAGKLKVQILFRR